MALDQYLGNLSKSLSLDLGAIKSVLDWGGADGRFMPNILSESRRYTYEISDIVPVRDVQKLDSLPAASEYDFFKLRMFLSMYHIP